jgi:predicted permease
MLRDLRYALRQMRANPGLSAVIVLSLALGIGANTAIFSLVNTVMLSSLPVQDPGRLVLLAWGANEWPKGLNQSGMGGPQDTGFRAGSYSLPYPFFETLQEHTELFSSVFGFAPLGTSRQNTTIVADGQAMRVDAEMIAGDYFGGLGVTPLVGHVPARGEQGQAVISYAYWARQFGRHPAIVGKTISINGLSFAIAGVMGAEFFGVQPGRTPDIWVPAVDSPALTPWAFRPRGNPSLMTVRAYWWLPVMARLKPGVTAAQVSAALDPAFQRFTGDALGLPADSRGMPHLLATPAGRGLDFMRRTFSQPLVILMAVVGLVLLIACANVATLLLARGAVRRREIAIRLSLGASRARLFRQLLTESVTLAAAGGVLGLLAAAWGARALTLLLPASQRPDLEAAGLSTTVVVFTAAMSTLTGLVFGVVPAARATRFEVAGDLKPAIGFTAAARSRHRWDSGLVVAQVALSLVLVFGAALFVRTLLALQRQDLGVDARNLLVAGVDASQNGYSGARLAAVYEGLLERLARTPGVVSVTCSRLPLFAGWVSNGSIAIAGTEPKPAGMDVHRNGVGPAFAETMGMKVRLGRMIDWNDVRAARRVVVINDAAAQYFFGGANVLGQRISFGPGPYRPADDYEIAGVVQNAKYASVRGEAPRTAYMPFTAMPSALGALAFQIRTAGDPLAIIPSVRRIVSEIDPTLALADVRTETDQIAASLWQERLFAELVSAFGALALVLACIGVYGTMSYAVARRTREIGVRMAIGAQRGHVLRSEIGRAMRLALAGVALGAPLTLAASRFVASQLFGVTPSDPLTMTVAIVVLVGITAAAGYLPALRASRVDPMVALRAE